MGYLRWVMWTVAICLAAVILTTHRAQADPFWPVPGPVVSDFDAPDPDWLPGHRGIDVQAPPGTAIRSPRPGTVTFAGTVGGVAVVVVSHGVLRSTFQPARATSAVGSRVAAGDVVAEVVSAGSHCAITCLHWGARVNEQYVDPRLLLGSITVVLRPVPD